MNSLALSMNVTLILLPLIGFLFLQREDTKRFPYWQTFLCLFAKESIHLPAT